MEELLDFIKSVKVKNRPNAVPCSYRIIYRVTLILLIMNICCGGRKGCSMEKIQIISEAISYEKYLEKLKLFLYGKSNFIMIRYDPSLNRALSYAMAEDLISIQGNKLFKVTSKGKDYIEKIKRDKDIFRKEKGILVDISTNLTEEKIQNLMIDWRLDYVEN